MKSGTRIAWLFAALILAGFSLCIRCVRAQNAPTNAFVALDKPFLFSYGTWEGHTSIENGVVLLDAAGVTPKGGGGVNTPIDLSAHPNNSPGLRVKVGPRNTLKTLNLMVSDTGGHTATWRFAVPAAPTADYVVLMPTEGSSFADANEVGKTGAPDLSKIMQWQLMGDWGGDGAVDVRVNALLSIAPDAAVTAARAARAQKAEEARQQAVRDRADARVKYGKRTADSPQISAVYAAAPDVLALQIHTGKITPGSLTDYKPQPGDQTKKQDNTTRLIRGDKEVGMLVGLHKDGLFIAEGFSGDPLLLAEADDPANYKLRSTDDPAFTAATAPLAVVRKSKPDDWQQPIMDGKTILHTVYLRLPHPLTPGKTYTVSIGFVNTQTEQAALVFDPAKTWTESIHINQVGFRPDDPVKQAFVSLWMGKAGGYDFPAGMTFHLVDALTGAAVFTGKAGEAWAADKLEKMQNARNFNGAAVTPLDFSEFKTPGRYRVELAGVGVSYPFEISDKVWEGAFKIQMKGFYNQRSGVDVGPPYSTFKKPTDFHPGINNCVPITQSTLSNLDADNSQAALAKGDTGKPVPEAWGGYHDAGDWNPRRITHMTTTTFWQLELLDMYPGYFKGITLHIPNDAPGPDLLKECLFELSLFHRLQMTDGGVGFGIETNGDPYGGEASWNQDMPAYVYAPDALSSYLYAAVASRAAQVLKSYDPAMSATYSVSAVKAMAWAEADRVKPQSKGTWARHPELVDERARAAACLLALTHEARWNAIVVEYPLLKAAEPPVFRGNTTARDAFFTYARLPQGVGDEAMKQNAKRAILADADGSLGYQQGNAFGIASDDFGKPQFLGFYSTPHGAVSMVRAHYLTHDAKYLAGAVKACLFPAGANPGNIVYTTGVGANPVKHVLNLDAIVTGQKVPDGLTAYGNVDLQRWPESWITWPITWHLGKVTEPDAYSWPTTELFYDVRFMPGLDEFCTDQTMGPNAYVWGYLAARP